MLFGALIFFFLFAPQTFAATYSYYRTITVTSSVTAASGTQTNFPMLVSSTISSWASTGHGGNVQNLVTVPNGGQEPADLVFATSSANCGTANLNFETESYSSSTGALVDWVNVPSLSAGSVIYACYGSPSVTTDQSHPSSTWNSNYAEVYHFSHLSNDTIVNANDSTANANNLTNHSSVTAASGTIGGAAGVVKGSPNSWLEGGPGFFGNPMTQTSSFAISTWVDPSSSNVGGDWTMVATLGGGIGWGIGIDYRNSPADIAIHYPGSAFVNSGCNASNDTWQYIALVNSGGVGTIYKNGVACPTTTSATPNTGFGGNTWISGDQSTLNGINASIDETHFLSAPLSPSWILTEYNNQANPGIFYTVGAETGGGGGAQATYGGNPVTQFLKGIFQFVNGIFQFR